MSSKVLYILSLCNDKYYVGSTDNVNDHDWDMSASEWVRHNSPFCIIEVHPCTSPRDVDVQVKRLMCLHGVDNVRGGSFRESVLAADTARLLSDIARHTKEKQPILCSRCGRNSHLVDKCMAKTYFGGRPLDD